MYAVIRTGGKQYRVGLGDVIEVEHLALKGNKTTFTPLLVKMADGKTVAGPKDLKSLKVEAKIVGDGKGKKVDVRKYQPKSGFQTRRGHRQLYSLIEITAIGDEKLTL
jgi:large subunit ribosomal protein L21